MTENKRFTLHIGWYNYDKTEGDAELKDNGQPLLISKDIEGMRYVKDLLNELHTTNNAQGEIITQQIQQLERLEKENEQLKQQLANIDRLIYDLGHDEMRRQYEEIFKGDVE